MVLDPWHFAFIGGQSRGFRGSMTIGTDTVRGLPYEIGGLAWANLLRTPGGAAIGAWLDEDGVQTNVYPHAATPARYDGLHLFGEGRLPRFSYTAGDQQLVDIVNTANPVLTMANARRYYRIVIYDVVSGTGGRSDWANAFNQAI